MNNGALKQFFKPDGRKVLIFLIFMAISFGGYIQSWVFSGRELGTPKPVFFDLLEPFPFWVIWTFLLLPLGWLSNLLVAVGGYDADFIMRGPFWFFGVINVIYFYTLSCLIVFIWDKLRAKK